jgi:hypothetical protein
MDADDILIGDLILPKGDYTDFSIKIKNHNIEFYNFWDNLKRRKDSQLPLWGKINYNCNYVWIPKIQKIFIISEDDLNYISKNKTQFIQKCCS